MISTLAYIMLFTLLRGSLGAQGANFFALLVTAIANTSANRRLTFGIRSRAGAGRAQAQGLGVFLLGLIVTSGSLAGLHLLQSHPRHTVELTVLVIANLVATVIRFVLLRQWVFRRHELTGSQSGSTVADPVVPSP